MKLDALHPRNWFRKGAERDNAGSDRRDDDRLAAPIPFDVECSREADALREALEFAGTMDLLYEAIPEQPAECGFKDTRRLDVDIAVENDTYVVVADVPGLSRIEDNGMGDGDAADLHVKTEGYRLSITGRTRSSSRDKGLGWHRMERQPGSFRRILVLPDDAVPEALSASVNDGVLTVSIPRASSEECVWVPGEAPRAGCHA
ncbi:Hsp20/alpha crystallin family protein [Desulfovibrio oxamicus]|uniref:Hsp20/alpha crystallin family protein n=1 Tax=Nitratidesulfovibrio oxamicus TaxID=32016 RepID=A0ABS0J3X4_9BACT|nr:Hsp20/alpha crystallin family protein [Nitratidesulfovibrio oxamicus]MBG3877133.1 Hsp20/alpha crystallin family protein [Nitratidesulfovibrio oxamicus]